MSGHTDFHEELERELAAFVNKESAYLLNFGYQGILSTIDTLVGKNDIIVYDVDSHACIIDGVRLHMGKRFTYKHNDVESLEKNLQRATKVAAQTGGGLLVISEGVFGMRGEQGKLKEIAALKEKYNFRFLVDDAHGFGTLGKNGAGAGIEQDSRRYRRLFRHFCQVHGLHRCFYSRRQGDHRLPEVQYAFSNVC